MDVLAKPIDLKRSESLEAAVRDFAETGLAAYNSTAVSDPAGFGQLAKEITGSDRPIMYEDDRISPRSQVDGAVYTSTDFSALAPIFFHNECAGKHEWPQFICFFCSKVADEGGQTTISESHRILDQLRDETRRAFEDRKVLYKRTLGGSRGNSLLQNFGTEDRDEIQALCDQQEIEVEWVDDLLRLSYRRDAIFRHPTADETVWFNNVFFWSPLALDRVFRRSILKMPENQRPFMSYFGDGGEIPDDMITEIGDLFTKNKVDFSWAAGDILVLDNMRYAHGREKFKGERTVWTTMLEPRSKSSKVA